MMMKMAPVSTIAVLLLCCSVFPSADSKDVCDHYAATNGDFAVPLQHKLQDSEILKWKHDKKEIFNRRPDKLLTGKAGDVYQNGSLRLTNLNKTQAGTYTPEVFNSGKAIKDLKSIKLCILDPVSMPQVNIQCLLPNVKFICSGNQDRKDLNIEWLKNNKVLENTKGQVLKKIAEDVKTDTFSCRVSNLASSMTSAPAKETCTVPGFVFPETLFGINIWILVGTGAGFVLVLIIIIVLCCIGNRRKKRVQLKDEEELRLGWTNPNQHHHHNHPADQHHHHHHHQQQPAGHTGPRQHRSKQQRPREPDQPAAHPHPSPRRPAQGPRPVANDDEQPPPLPQPRKKAPRKPRVQQC